MIYELQNFLDDETCDVLIDYFKTSKKRSEWQKDEFFSGRTLSPSEICDEDIKKRMEIFKSKTLQSISRLFHENHVFLESWDLVYWPTGIKMEPHADNIKPDKTPNSCPQRDYSSICYLNDDYEGGEIEFPNFGVKIKPEPGMLILFPSNFAYAHRAHPVTKGTKYAMVTWIRDRS